MPCEIPGEGKAAEAYFQDHQIRHKFDQILGWEEYDEPVKRAGHIIGIQGQKIGANAHIPGIGHTVPAVQLAQHFRKKRNILMIHIGMHKAFVTERENTVNDENGEHDQERYGEGKQAYPIAADAGPERRRTVRSL